MAWADLHADILADFASFAPGIQVDAGYGAWDSTIDGALAAAIRRRVSEYRNERRSRRTASEHAQAKACRHCGVPLVHAGPSSRRLYCSASCRSAWWYARQAAEAEASPLRTESSRRIEWARRAPRAWAWTVERAAK